MKRSQSGFYLPPPQSSRLVEFTEVDFTTGLRIPQPQCVSGVGVVTGDDLIIRDGQNLFRLNPACFFTFLLNAPAKSTL